MHPMVQQLTQMMQQAADPAKAGPMQAYMKPERGANVKKSYFKPVCLQLLGQRPDLSQGGLPK